MIRTLIVLSVTLFYGLTLYFVSNFLLMINKGKIVCQNDSNIIYMQLEFYCEGNIELYENYVFCQLCVSVRL